MSSLLFISENVVKDVLDWSNLISVLEKALVDVSERDGTVIVPPRLYMRIPDKNGVLLNMPAYSRNISSFGCKLVTSFPGNLQLSIPSIFGTILLFDPDTGKPKAVVDGGQITGWRTAGVSAIATKYMHKREKKVLSILGAGVQARTHIMAFQHLFTFKEIRIWNRTKASAVKLASELACGVRVCDSPEECCRGADVICTTTYSATPIVKLDWLKPGAHLNAVGASSNHYSELEEEIYRNGIICVEHLESALVELEGLLKQGISITFEIGKVIGGAELPVGDKFTVFQSLGLAVEDVAAADLVYCKYTGQK